MAKHPLFESRREALCVWLRANNVDPKYVPQDADLTIGTEGDQRVIRYEAYTLDFNGRRILNERGNDAAIERRTAPLLVDPPEWWEPYEKPTREQLLQAVDRVRQLHIRNDNTGCCEYCSARDYPDYSVAWPCATVQALGGTTQEAQR